MNLYPLIADKVEKDPAIVDMALTTLAHWKAIDAAPPARLTAWTRILDAAKRGNEGRKRLLSILRSDTERNRRLLDCAPFAGVLTREERRKVFLKCTYDH